MQLQAIYGSNVPKNIDHSKYSNLPNHLNRVYIQNDLDKQLEQSGRVQFVESSKVNLVKSERAGAYIFEPCDYCIIKVNNIERPVVELKVYENGLESEQRKEKQGRFPNLWKQFLESKTDGLKTPLNAIPKITLTQIAQLNSCGLDCVEKLQYADDLTLKFVDGGKVLRAKADAYLNLSTDKVVEAKQLENDALQDELKRMAKEIEELKNADNTKDVPKRSKQNRAKTT